MATLDEAILVAKEIARQAEDGEASTREPGEEG